MHLNVRLDGVGKLCHNTKREVTEVEGSTLQIGEANHREVVLGIEDDVLNEHIRVHSRAGEAQRTLEHSEGSTLALSVENMTNIVFDIDDGFVVRHD